MPMSSEQMRELVRGLSSDEAAELEGHLALHRTVQEGLAGMAQSLENVGEFQVHATFVLSDGVEDGGAYNAVVIHAQDYFDEYVAKKQKQ